MKIGFPNMIISLIYILIVGFLLLFFGTLIFNPRVFSGMPGLMWFFVLIALAFTCLYLYHAVKNLEFIYVDKEKLVSYSIFPINKRVVLLRDITSVDWECVIDENSGYVRLAKINSKTTETIILRDIRLENFDSIIDAIPWSNTERKKEVSKLQAKNNIWEAAIFLVLVTGTYIFFLYAYGVPFQRARMFGFDLGILILCGLLVIAYAKRCLKYRRALAQPRT